MSAIAAHRRDDARRRRWDGWSNQVTGGWRAVTNGELLDSQRGRFIAVWAFFAVIGAITMIVNVATRLDDRAAAGLPIPAWEPWTWEASSFLAWSLLVPLILLAVDRLRPPRFALPAVLALHLLLTLLISFAHVALMVAVRYLVYALAQAPYDLGGSLADVLLYEYRKDAATYLIVALLYLLLERIGRPAAATADPFRIEVRDGGVTRWLAPADVEWAQAAGNYVELHGAFGQLLLRRPIGALAEELAPHGFRRIHRARIVRNDAIALLETKQSGDFEVQLASGARLSGSRRFR